MKQTIPFKALIAIIAVLASINFTNAQSSMQIGVAVGPTVACVRGDDVDEDEINPLMGFVAGVQYQYNFNPNLSLNTGLLFERRGYTWRTEVDLFGFEQTNILRAHYDYVSIPLLFRANFLAEDGPRLFVNVGPGFNFLTGVSSTSIVITDGDRDVDHDEGDTDDVRKVDFNFVAGIGMQVPIGDRFNFGVELRNNLGLCTLPEDKDDGEIFTNNAMLLLSFNMALGQ